MSDRELIDPLNPDTYDDRVIVHSGIKTPVPNDKYCKGWERIFGAKWFFLIKVKKYECKVSIH